MNFQSSKIITPLVVIVAFLSITETFAIRIIPSVQGNVQEIFTWFACIFATVVFLAFFAILWFKANVLYPPSEYGDMDPMRYRNAVRNNAPSPIAEKIANLEAQPDDEAAQFELMSSLLAFTTRQKVILLHEESLSLPFCGRRYSYKTALSADGAGAWHWSSGSFSADELYKKLKGTGLLQVTEDVDTPTLSLTPRGNRFAQWLIKEGKKATFFKSELGEWGDESEFKEFDQSIGPPACESNMEADVLTAAHPSPF